MKMQCYYVAQVYKIEMEGIPHCRYVAGPFQFYSDAAEARQKQEYNSYSDQYHFEVVIADIEVIL